MAEIPANEENSPQAALIRLLGGRTGVIIAIGITVIALTLVIWYATRPSYKVLYAGLPEGEAGRVVEQLATMNIPYELAGGGSTVRIPSDKVYDVRLSLATMGMPKSEGIGFEIFDKTGLMGMTDFMQRTNFQRALQGELARTTERIDAVRKARVHLVLPQRSLFVAQDKKPTASIIMELTRTLTSAQISGIVHLVAASVEGLSDADVTLLDHKGTLIAGGRREDPDGRMPTDEGLAMQRRIEKSLEDRVQSMLDRVLGVQRSITRVTAELDLSRVERHQELFDPEGQVSRSEQFVTEGSRGVTGAGGAPGVQPNDANAQAAAEGGGSSQSRNVEKETINYEISKTVNKILLPVGTIKRLSVAVLVDGLYVVEEEGGKPVYKDRASDEMQRLQEIVEQAVGLQKSRGDSIEVKNIPFESVEPPVIEEGLWMEPAFYLTLAKYIAFAVAVALIVFFVLRPLIKQLIPVDGKVMRQTGESASGQLSELEEQMLAAGVGSGAQKQGRQIIPDRALAMSRELLSEHTDEAREILRHWMAQK